MKTKVKVAVQMKAPGVPGWPCINYDYDKELARVMEPVYAKNPDIDFDIFKYTSVDMAKADYELKCAAYEKIYNKKVSYEFSKADIAGLN